MSRRPGSGHSHPIRQNVREDVPRDVRQPPQPHLARYIEPPPPPAPPLTRSDAPHYTPYQVPTSRLSYAPDTRHPAAEPRPAIHPQRHMDISRSHEHTLLYPRPAEYYTAETPMPPVHQPAPRQRTAVACRYCRRRKIRCSGYQSSPDGRCTNCVQRDQKCEFLPVSASPYEAPRPETSYLTPPQTIPHVPIGGHRPSQTYSLPPPPPASPSYHLAPHVSPRQQRKRPAEAESVSPPRKRPMIEPSSVGRPTLTPIQIGGSLRRRPTLPDSRPGYLEIPIGTPYTEHGQRSPPYTTAMSPRRRQDSIYSSASSLQPLSSIPSARSTDISPYTVLPPLPPPHSPTRATPVTRRYSYQPHTPYSPEQVYPPRPISQGGTHIPSPRSSAVALPPPPPRYSRPSPSMHRASAPARPASDYPDRSTISPGYEYGEPTTTLPPLAHLNRDTPPIQSSSAPAIAPPIPLSLPPPIGMITAPRNPRDSAILSAFDTVSESPSSRAQVKGTPSPEAGHK